LFLNKVIGLYVLIAIDLLESFGLASEKFEDKLDLKNELQLLKQFFFDE
jgi:hypothetical protein